MRMIGDIDPQRTEEVKVQSRPSGLWWIVTGKERQDQEVTDNRSVPTGTGKRRKDSSASDAVDRDTTWEQDKVAQDKDVHPPREKPVRRYTKERSGSCHESDSYSITSVDTKCEARSVGKGMTGWLSRTTTSASIKSDTSAHGFGEKNNTVATSKGVVESELPSKPTSAAPRHGQTPVEGQFPACCYVMTSYCYL